MDCVDFAMDKNDICGMDSLTKTTAPASNLIMTGGMSRPMDSFRQHGHSHWEIVLYTYGTGTLSIGEHSIPFRPGTVVCTPPRMVHSEVSDSGFQNMWVALQELEVDTEIPVLQLYPDHPIFALVPIMQVEQRLKRPASELILHNLFNVFMMYLNEHLAHDPHQRLIARLARIITANLENPAFRIGEAFKDLPLSADHLRRLFTDRMGRTPVQYLIDLRMDRAKELLQMGFSVKETADRVGIDDQYYFSRLFHRTQGVSPTAYRGQLVRKPVVSRAPY
jgi:AraC-like DNA-binding protein